MVVCKAGGGKRNCWKENCSPKVRIQENEPDVFISRRFTHTDIPYTLWKQQMYRMAVICILKNNVSMSCVQHDRLCYFGHCSYFYVLRGEKENLCTGTRIHNCGRRTLLENKRGGCRYTGRIQWILRKKNVGATKRLELEGDLVSVTLLHIYGVLILLKD